MDESTLNRLLEAIEPLATKLGEGAEHVYALAVRQAYIEAVTNILWALFFAAATLASYRFVTRWCIPKAKEAGKRNNDGYVVGGVMGAVGGVFAAVLVAVSIDTALNALLNPEFRAIQILMETVRG